MSTALQTGALLCSVLGLLSALAVLMARHDLRRSLEVLLEFLLAGGLLRLSDDPSARSIATAAVLVAVRRLLQLDLRPH